MEQLVFCETDQLCEPLMGPHPEATVAGWEQARLRAMRDFWDQWISPSISVCLRGSSFWSEHDFWPRSLFGSIYGRHVATTKSDPRLQFSLCIHCPSEPHQPKYLIQLWVILLYLLLCELTALHGHSFISQKLQIIIKSQWSHILFASWRDTSYTTYVINKKCCYTFCKCIFYFPLHLRNVLYSHTPWISLSPCIHTWQLLQPPHPLSLSFWTSLCSFSARNKNICSVKCFC